MKVACELCSVEKCRDDIPIHVKLYCLESEIECSFARCQVPRANQTEIHG